MSVGESVNHEVHCIIEGHHEAGHVRVCDGDRLAGHHLLHPERNHRATGCHHIAVACAADGRRCILSKLASLGDRHLLHQGLGYSHRVDRIGSLVCGKDNDILNSMLDGRKEDVVGSDDVGHRCFHREELA